MKPANWTLQTKTFPKLLQFKGSNDDAVEFAGILQFWHRCSGIHRDFTILTHLAQLVPNLIWELPSLPHHLPFEGWLERHHYATQALQQGCCPFIHKWLWPHKGHKLFSLKKKGMVPGYEPFLELMEFSPSLDRPKFTLLLHVPSTQGTQLKGWVRTVLRNCDHRLLGKRPDKLTKFLFFFVFLFFFFF